jgi:hypothetical protein
VAGLSRVRRRRRTRLEHVLSFRRAVHQLRALKALFCDPMGVLPAFGILIVSAALIWVGIVML